MKARVNATGEIVEVKYSRQIGPDAMYKDIKTGKFYVDFELSILPEDGTPDYWENLFHQYTGMAMNALLITNNIKNGDLEEMQAAESMIYAYIKEKEADNYARNAQGYF